MSNVLNMSDIISDINTEKTHYSHAKCPSQSRGMSVINPVNAGQNVRYFKKVCIYTDLICTPQHAKE